MNPLNAGLPKQTSVGSQPIGVSGVFPKGPSLITDEAGGQWLASGSSALAAAYPKAAKLSHLQLHGAVKSLGGSLPTTLKWSVAVSDAGIILIAYGSTTQLLRSTDGGLTLGTVSCNAGGLAIGLVLWNPVAQRFYALTNDTGTHWGAMSTTADGSAFNANFSASMGGVGPHTAASVRAVVNPTSGRIILRSTYGTSGPYSTIDSGAQAFVTRGFTGAPTVNTRLAINTAGTLAIDMPLTTGALLSRSTDDGVTWGNPGNTWVSPAAGADFYPVWHAPANAFFVFTDSARYYAAPSVFTASDYVAFTLPGSRFANSPISFINNKIVFGIKDPQGQNARQFLVSADGYTWEGKGTSVGLGSINKGLAVFGGSLGCIILPVDDGAAQSTGLQTPSLDAPLYVGTPYASDIQVAAGNPPTVFVKVK